MKKIMFCIMSSAILSTTSCEQNKKSTVTESGTEVVQVRTPTADTLDKTEVPPTETRSVEGKVLSVSNGKDGYTAQLKSSEGKVFYATISRANLDDPKQYCSVSLGDQLKVSGDYWKLEEKDQITVRKISK